jgi:hypothetical protein
MQKGQKVFGPLIRKGSDEVVRADTTEMRREAAVHKKPQIAFPDG